MCIIIAVPSGKNVSKQTIKRCWQNNPDGGGFMYNKDSKVKVFKELNSFNRYYKEYTRAKEENGKSAFVLHFRISTHGVINETNCHPFLVSPSLGFAHNGIISAAPYSKNFSDTFMFNETILKQLPSGFLGKKVYTDLLTNYIGYGSKLAFLDFKGNITLVNESAGVWDEGIWYSNKGYNYAKYYDVGGTKVGGHFGEGSKKGIHSTAVNYVPLQKEIKYNYPQQIDKHPTFEEFKSAITPKCEECGCNLITSQERANYHCADCFEKIVDSPLSRGERDILGLGW